MILICHEPRRSPAPPGPPARRGIATMLAIILLMLMAGTVTAMTLVFATQNHRTQAAGAGAQLRQLLAAGVPIARGELVARGGSSRTVPVATPIEGATLKLIFTDRSQTESQVRVIATWKNFTAIQTVDFAQQSNAWMLQSLKLIQSP